MYLTSSRLASLLASFPSLHIGVVGDFTLDGYWTADMSRAALSRETPLFNRPVTSERYSPGGAANVAWNLVDLGVNVWAYTVFGDDWRGAILHRLLEALGVHTDGILTIDNWQTPFYGKVILSGYHSQQEDARLDFVNTQALDLAAEEHLADAIQSGLPRLDALVVADYQQVGVITPTLRQVLDELANSHPDRLFLVDSRENLADFQDMIAKPNEVEAARLLFPGRNLASLDMNDFIHGVQVLAARTHRAAFITLGEAGCLVCAQPGESTGVAPVQHVPARQVPPPIDTVGAGDTFSAALASALAAGATPVEAAQLACLASAVTIRKLGVTGTATPAEIELLLNGKG